MERIIITIVLLVLLLSVGVGIGCATSIETAKIYQLTMKTVIIESNGSTFEDDYQVAYQIIFQLDKQVGVQSYGFNKRGRTLVTTVQLEQPAYVTMRRYALNDSYKLNYIEVITFPEENLQGEK